MAGKLYGIGVGPGDPGLLTLKAKTILENGEMLDAVTVMLDSAADNLMELTGEKSSEKVIDDVFSRFCVGK